MMAIKDHIHFIYIYNFETEYKSPEPNAELNIFFVNSMSAFIKLWLDYRLFGGSRVLPLWSSNISKNRKNHRKNVIRINYVSNTNAENFREIKEHKSSIIESIQRNRKR